MKKLLFLLLVLSFALGQANAQSGSAMWFQDPWLQMNAIRLDTPPGWKAACDIVWDFGNPAIPCRFWLKAANSDDTRGLEVYPGANFNCSQQPMQQFGAGRTYMGQTLLAPYTAIDFLRQLVIPKFRASAKQRKELAAEALPDVARQVSAQAQAPADAASVTISYVNEKGVEIKETFTCTIAYHSSYNYCGWVPQAVLSVKVPKGGGEKAAEAEIEAILSTMAVNPNWTAAHVQIRNAIAQNMQQQIINTSEAAGRYARQGAKTSQAQSDVLKERRESMGRIAQKREDVMMGNERFVDAAGNEHVEPTYRAQGWINGLGQTVYSPNSSTYNPNFDPNFNGSAWERMRVK